VQWTTSRYVHLYSATARRVVFNSLNLEAFDVDEAEAALLERYKAPEIPPPDQDATWRSLVEAGLVVPVADNVAGRAVAQLNATRTKQFRDGGGRFRSLRVALTERCNMACTYCFQQKLYPDQQPRMSEETLRQTLEWFVDQAAGAPVSVQYFGGEPMLEWKLLVAGDAYLAQARRDGRISGYRQTMTTNGTLLTQERAQWLARHGFDLVFSFDGPPDINDKLRTYKNGRGTYDAAARGLHTWVAAGGVSTILMTATSLNLHLLPRIVRWFVEESDLHPQVIALNSPQPTTEGWETGGAELATVVFDLWTYLEPRNIMFQGPGTYIPGNLKANRSHVDNCVTGDINDPNGDAWPIYVSADGRRSMCLVHHRDHRVEVPADQDVQRAGLKWHKSQDSVADCDSCPASQLCGGPCSVERILWNGRLNEDRCGFMREMTRLVLTSG
jgi:uncharacterized protein